MKNLTSKYFFGLHIHYRKKKKKQETQISIRMWVDSMVRVQLGSHRLTTRKTLLDKIDVQIYLN